MVIEKTRSEKILNLANTFYLVAITICAATAFIYFFVIALQNIIIFAGNKFIFPFVPVIVLILYVTSIILFSMKLMKKDIRNDKSIIFEVLALIVPLFINTIFSLILELVNNVILRTAEMDYIAKYASLRNILAYVTIFMPFAFVFFVIATVMKLTITVISPTNVEIE